MPSFAAFLAFELHEQNGSCFVRIVYNPDPEVYCFSDCAFSSSDSSSNESTNILSAFCLDMPGPGQVISWEKRTLGRSIPLEEFKFLLMEDRRSFVTEEEWRSAASSDPEKLETSPVFATHENAPSTYWHLNGVSKTTFY